VDGHGINDHAAFVALHLSDLIGLDTLKLIADKMYEEFKEPLYSPPPLLLRMVEAGRLGKKSGRGFYTY
jgi:3-hydroxybutyryl-CoA dehydrogenase